jgi:hypothetical protein
MNEFYYRLALSVVSLCMCLFSGQGRKRRALVGRKFSQKREKLIKNLLLLLQHQLHIWNND